MATILQTRSTPPPSGNASSVEDTTLLPKRSRSGCLPCRQSRVKCDEAHPSCSRCKERSEQCKWPSAVIQPKRRHKKPRLFKSCDPCRDRKLKCGGPIGLRGSCSPCLERDAICAWDAKESRIGATSSSHRSIPDPEQSGLVHSGHPQEASSQSTSRHSGILNPSSVSHLRHSPRYLARPSIVQPSEWGSVKELIRLYFSTVHHFGYLSFVHEVDFWDRMEHGQIPEELSLLMAANGLRFGGQMTSDESLTIADRWAETAATKLLPQVLAEFGAIELMAVLLCQHYDFMSGRYSRGYVLVGMAVQMMTFLRLNNIDEDSPTSSKPLLSAETLRRLAWSVYFLDATISGGVFGQSSLTPSSFTIQLPAEERPFLQHVSVPTQLLTPPLAMAGTTNLGLGGHLIRAMWARQVLAGLHSQVQRRLIPTASVSALIAQARADTQSMLDSLPLHMEYSKRQYRIYKDQTPMLVSLHVMRNTSRRHGYLLELAGALLSVDDHGQETRGIPPIIEANVSAHRTGLIEEAKKLSEIFFDAADMGVALDPQLAMHAYNGIEILLFHPSKLDATSVKISVADIQRLLNPLMDTIRRLSSVSALVKLLYPEAVNRMIRMGFVDGLTNDDILAVLKKIHSMSSADSEFDFSKSFWRYELSLARLHGLPHPDLVESPRTSINSAAFGETTSLPAVSPNEILLELHPVDVVPPCASTPGTSTNLLSTSHNGPAIGSTIDPNQIAWNGPVPHHSTNPSSPVNPLVRLQTMFQGVRSRAVSPASFESSIARATAGIHGVGSHDAQLPVGEASGSHAQRAASMGDGYTALLDELDFPLPLLEDPSPFMWNFWNEQITRQG